LSDQNPKVFIVSLDGATFDVIEPLVKQGYMPTLARVLNDGLSARLQSVIPPVTAPAWTSFMTGKHPGKHGIFEFSQFDPQAYSWRLNHAQHIQSKTIWQLLSEQGKRSVVVHLPFTYPPSPIAGLIVAGWDAPSIEANFTYPPKLRETVLRLIPDYAASHDVWLWRYEATNSDRLFQRFLDRHAQGVEHGVRLARYLLDAEPWDVFMVHFQQTDWVQHKVWSYIEQACRNPEDKRFRVEAIRKWFQAMDQSLSQLLEEARRFKPSLIVLSDHGFGPDNGNICVNHYLKKWGLFVPDRGAEAPFKDFFRKSKLKPLKTSYQTLATFKHRHLDNRKYKSWAAFTNSSGTARKFPIDWRNTRASLITGGETGFVFINVKGRGPSGTVEPGREYQRLVTELISRFRELRHPRTGEKLIDRALPGTEVYSSAAPGILLPDIVLLPAPGYGFSMVAEHDPPHPTPEGCHRPDGILILQGGEFVGRHSSDFEPQLIDIAPTILHMLGLAVPKDMDGRVLEEIFTQARPVQYQETDTSVAQQERAIYTTREAELIEERLRGMGYIE
jgi:predicted AlkP superfamily phosphohydrolase/phosphomutase